MEDPGEPPENHHSLRGKGTGVCVCVCAHKLCVCVCAHKLLVPNFFLPE